LRIAWRSIAGFRLRSPRNHRSLRRRGLNEPPFLPQLCSISSKLVITHTLTPSRGP